MLWMSIIMSVHSGLYDHVAMYDEYPRNVVSIMQAESTAAHTEDRANSMESALAEAALLTGIVRKMRMW